MHQGSKVFFSRRSRLRSGFWPMCRTPSPGECTVPLLLVSSMTHFTTIILTRISALLPVSHAFVQLPRRRRGFRPSPTPRQWIQVWDGSTSWPGLHLQLLKMLQKTWGNIYGLMEQLTWGGNVFELLKTKKVINKTQMENQSISSVF